MTRHDSTFEKGAPIRYLRNGKVDVEGGIIQGASYDNNLLCIGEKEVFVVEKVFDRMIDRKSVV